MSRPLVPLLLLLLTITACTTAAPPREDAAAEVKRHFMNGIDAFNRHDLETFLQQFDDEMDMYAAFDWVRGGAAIRERFVTTLRQYPDVRMEIDSLNAREVAPNVVTVDFRFHTYPTGSGPAWHGVGSGVYVNRGSRWVEVLEHETVTKADEGARVLQSGRDGT